MREWLEGQWQDRKIGLIALRRRSASLLDIFRGLLFCLLVCLFLLWKKRKHSVMVSFWVRPVRSLTGRNKKKTIVGNYSAARKLESRKCPLYFGRFLGRRSSFSVFFFFEGCEVPSLSGAIGQNRNQPTIASISQLGRKGKGSLCVCVSQ